MTDEKRPTTTSDAGIPVSSDEHSLSPSAPTGRSSFRTTT